MSDYDAYTKRCLISEYNELLYVYTMAVLDHDNGGDATSRLLSYLTKTAVASLWNEDVTQIERQVELLRRQMVAQFPDSQYMRDVAAGVY